MSQLHLHPLCELFPEPTDDEFRQIRQSINKHGQREAIVLLGNQILDGRTRYFATRELKIPPRTRQYDPQRDGPDPLAWVVDKNLHRRHLTVGQRAALALEIEKAIREAAPAKAVQESDAEEAAEQKHADAEAQRPRTQAAHQAGVSTGSVAKAKQLAEKDPEGFEDVKSGKKSLSGAHKEAASRQKDLIEPDAKRIESADLMAPTHGDLFADAIRASSILKGPELARFVKLPTQRQIKIRDLVANGWKVADAERFASANFTLQDRIGDLVSLAQMSGAAATSAGKCRVIAIQEDELAKLIATPLAEVLQTINDKQNK